MIDILRRNIDTEIDMLREVSHYSRMAEFARGVEKKQVEATIQSLIQSMKLVNSAIPDLVNAAPHDNKLPTTSKNTGLAKITFKRESSDLVVGIKANDKEKFLKELSISENLIKKIKRMDYAEEEKFEDFKAARGYLKLSNRIFLNSAIRYIKNGYFRPLYNELKKANIDVLFETYVAMMFFTTLISAVVGVILTAGLLFFNVGVTYPFLTPYNGEYLDRIVRIFWIPFALPLATFLTLYIYPSTEKSSIAKRIDGELPFAVIHMSAISGSGIAPSEIFKIIGLSKEYPFLRREIRKVLNQTNIYGYDLVTALNNVSKSTPSQKLAELFNGIATTVNSGGNLSEFFEKRAETLLGGYRLERERFTQVAGTFMDIYISVVIATPMILMLLLVMLSLTGIQTGFTPLAMGFIIILLIALVNTFFLAFLQIKQPTY